MLPRGWSLIYIDFDNGALRCLMGAQLIKQQQLRGELRNMQMRNEILMDFLHQWFDYKGSDLGSLSISHWAVFTEYPPTPRLPPPSPALLHPSPLLKISCHQHSSAVSPKQLWNIPGNQSPSSQLTISNHKHVKMSEYFGEILQKSRHIQF